MKRILTCIALIGPVSFAVAQEKPATPAAPAAAPAAVTTPTTAAAIDPSTVVISFGDQKMTAGEFNGFIDSLPPEVQSMARGVGKRMLAEKLVEIKLLAAEARKQGLDKDPKVIMGLKLYEEQMLAQSLAEKAAQPDDKALKAEFDKDPSKYDQLKVRHILVRSNDAPVPAAPGKKDLTPEEALKKATDLRTRIVDKKEDFAAIAKAESDDVSSGRQGGDLGVIDRNAQFIPEFKDAAFNLKVGDVSQPVKTVYGYHLIQVESRTPQQFDDVKRQLSGQQGAKQVDALVKSLKESGNVKLDDAFFGPAASRPAGHP